MKIGNTIWVYPLLITGAAWFAYRAARYPDNGFLLLPSIVMTVLISGILLAVAIAADTIDGKAIAAGSSIGYAVITAAAYGIGKAFAGRDARHAEILAAIAENKRPGAEHQPPNASDRHG